MVCSGANSQTTFECIGSYELRVFFSRLAAARDFCFKHCLVFSKIIFGGPRKTPMQNQFERKSLLRWPLLFRSYFVGTLPLPQPQIQFCRRFLFQFFRDVFFQGSLGTVKCVQTKIGLNHIPLLVVWPGDTARTHSLVAAAFVCVTCKHLVLFSQTKQQQKRCWPVFHCVCFVKHWHVDCH